jgi:aryl-alcohol dehydrogenase (NADP+)
MIPLCQSKGIGIIPWSPLARGFLAGNRRPAGEGFGETTRAKTDEFGQKLYWQESDFAVADRVVEVARRRSVAPAQIALAWVLQQPGVTAPIVGASKLQHLDDAVKALEIKLTDEELRAVAESYRPHAVLGH